VSTNTTEYKLIDRKIGLLGGSVLLMGSVIGISVFFLPGELIGDAGPSILLALVITAVPMLFSVLSLIQLGGAIPVAGGLYVYGSRLVSPAWGFISIWLLLPAIWATLTFTALGFAEFARFFVDVPASLLAVVVLLVFIGLNLRGVTLVAWVQLIMVGAIIASILAFVLPGLGQVEAANYTPLFPQGVPPALIAVVSLYIPFQGFSMIVELGEELQDPIRNIPRVLMLGMGIAVLLSIGLVAVFVGLDRWDALGGEGGIAQAASDHLPGWVAAAVAMGAVLGAFTTLNAIITSYSRTLMRASRDGVISPRLAELSRRFQVPYWSVLALSVPPVVFVVFRPSVVLLTVFLALVILFGNFVGSIALWNLPKRYPAAYEHSIYKLPLWLVKTSAIGSALFAVLFWLAIVSAAPPIVVGLLVIILAGAVYYRFRVRQLAGRGIDLTARLKNLHDHEAVRSGTVAGPAGATEAAETSTPVETNGVMEAEVPAGAATSSGARTDELAAPRAEPEDRVRVPAARPPRVRVATPPPSRRAVASSASTASGAGAASTNGHRQLPVIKGLGPARREAILAHFGSLDAVASADIGDLRQVEGVGLRLAERLHEALREGSDA
jgi:basic amino acid/polyamine antiporter, APA family